MNRTVSGFPVARRLRLVEREGEVSGREPILICYRQIYSSHAAQIRQISPASAESEGPLNCKCKRAQGYPSTPFASRSPRPTNNGMSLMIALLVAEGQQ